MIEYIPSQQYDPHDCNDCHGHYTHRHRKSSLLHHRIIFFLSLCIVAIYQQSGLSHRLLLEYQHQYRQEQQQQHVQEQHLRLRQRRQRRQLLKQQSTGKTQQTVPARQTSYTDHRQGQQQQQYYSNIFLDSKNGYDDDTSKLQREQQTQGKISMEEQPTDSSDKASKQKKDVSKKASAVPTKTTTNFSKPTTVSSATSATSSPPPPQAAESSSATQTTEKSSWKGVRGDDLLDAIDYDQEVKCGHFNCLFRTHLSTSENQNEQEEQEDHSIGFIITINQMMSDPKTFKLRVADKENKISVLTHSSYETQKAGWDWTKQLQRQQQIERNSSDDDHKSGGGGIFRHVYLGPPKQVDNLTREQAEKLNSNLYEWSITKSESSSSNGRKEKKKHHQQQQHHATGLFSHEYPISIQPVRIIENANVLGCSKKKQPFWEEFVQKVQHPRETGEDMERILALLDDEKNDDSWSLVEDFQVLADPSSGRLYHMDMDRPFKLSFSGEIKENKNKEKENNASDASSSTTTLSSNSTTTIVNIAQIRKDNAGWRFTKYRDECIDLVRENLEKLQDRIKQQKNSFEKKQGKSKAT